MDTPETNADIIAEMRKESRAERKDAFTLQQIGGYSNYVSRCLLEEFANYLEKLADRIEAARKRELSKNASKNGADFGQLGDFAKMREVMNRVHDYLGELIRDNLVEDTPRASDLADDVYDAIHGIHSTAEKSSPVGDAAKLREAVKAAIDKLMLWNYTDRDTAKMALGIMSKLDAALSATARNCDRPECATTKAAQDVWRKEDGGKTAYYEWLLATYKEGGNDGK